ncbi:probable methyltransferase-like protein 24 isoform X2 [Macrobrachium nipponense]|uniref:probable methyltransferase-like protein 24 isoform X2 n=1 Tax=Macrobrachium nipponense TaxID=159736 RepID=UPI0030C7DE53
MECSPPKREGEIRQSGRRDSTVTYPQNSPPPRWPTKTNCPRWREEPCSSHSCWLHWCSYADNLDCRPRCRIPSLVSGRQFYSYFAQKEYQCVNLRWFGSGDGRKAVCMDVEFNLVPGDCHILSFGINNEWSFDDAFARLGCKVYSFDPTMAQEDHQRSENVQFFKLGIGNMQGRRKIGMGQKFDYFEVDTYEHILDRLGLTNTTIDYLKMDIELSELDFFQDVFRNTPHLLKNVRQIGMELHHGYFGEGLGEKLGKRNDMGPTSTFQLFWQYFHELRCYGFKILHAHKNNPWTEVVWGRI